MAHDSVDRCAFSTERLLVGEWHAVAERSGLDLTAVVRGLLTAATTAELPTAWRGGFDELRASRWVDERDAESPTMLAIDRRTDRPVGLLFLYEDAAGHGDDEDTAGHGDDEDTAGHGDDEDGDRARQVDVRLGYVLAESAWGRGLATELVAGFVEWARSEPAIRSITGGVAPAHVASARVLRKNGFEPTTEGGEELTYRLAL